MSASTSASLTHQTLVDTPHCSFYLGHQLLGAEIHDFFEQVLAYAATAANGTTHPLSDWLSSTADARCYDESDLRSAVPILAALVDAPISESGLAERALDLEICLRLHLESMQPENALAS